MGSLKIFLTGQIEGETLSEAEWKRFEEPTELAAGPEGTGRAA
ncbi:MAG: hypothetical protein ACLUVG_07760 [Phocaeicola vulgatus]